MKTLLVVLSLALAATLCGEAAAQCQRGGGGGGSSGTPSMSSRTGTAITMPFVTSGESSQQMMQRLMAQEMARQYVVQAQQAYVRQVREQEETAAQAKEDKRQERLSYWRAQRDAEQERRAATRARNLARASTARSLARN
jgi:hypothetical protein